MQEELEQKSVAISIKAGKLTAKDVYKRQILGIILRRMFVMNWRCVTASLPAAVPIVPL